MWMIIVECEMNTHIQNEDMHSPCRSEIVSEPWVCSRFSVSSAACRLMFSLSSVSLLFSSMQHLSCSSLTWASSCCSCFELSVWVLRSRAAASDSARSNAFASSSCRREKERVYNGGMTLCFKDHFVTWSHMRKTNSHVLLQEDWNSGNSTCK